MFYPTVYVSMLTMIHHLQLFSSSAEEEEDREVVQQYHKLVKRSVPAEASPAEAGALDDDLHAAHRQYIFLEELIKALPEGLAGRGVILDFIEYLKGRHWLLKMALKAIQKRALKDRLYGLRFGPLIRHPCSSLISFNPAPGSTGNGTSASKQVAHCTLIPSAGIRPLVMTSGIVIVF